jgi:hypothetical protein
LQARNDRRWCWIDGCDGDASLDFELSEDEDGVPRAFDPTRRPWRKKVLAYEE